MKVFLVTTEQDGRTIKAPGISETERKRFEYRYGADTMQQVWDAIAFLRENPEVDILAIHEEYPAITIIPSSPDAALGDSNQGERK